ncbi:hypothetical protein [Actinokineospora iranica]|uniref:Uncharacterized protein n=1 Tax=Actinokineospora iranica TaxID=1271860 RepID=A0A1G6VQ35_9PSEU|nr:hypothetical protein [Actinokineospora iranica]SDD55651.1 hypothetical protein SAMN05216174_11333 [Actinokineospora iranica]
MTSYSVQTPQGPGEISVEQYFPNVELAPARSGGPAVRGSRAILASTGAWGTVWAVFERGKGSWTQVTGELTAEQLADWRQHISAGGFKPNPFEAWLCGAVEQVQPQDDEKPVEK